MHIDGGCHCGNITYKAEIDPDAVTICHCTDCQTLTGSPYRVTVQARKDNFRLSGGKPKLYRKTAESGAKRIQAFCPECGTPIYATSDEADPKSFGIRVGTTRQRAELVPRKQGWCRSAMPWSANIESLPRNEKQASR